MTSDMPSLEIDDINDAVFAWFHDLRCQRGPHARA